MKKTLFSLLLTLTLFSCSNHGDISNQTDDRFIYDYEGTIIDKYTISGNRGRYTNYKFIIKGTEDTSQLFEWGTDIRNYVNKEIGDSVHFDYIRKERLTQL